MLGSSLKEGSQSEPIVLQGIEGAALSLLVKYIYSGSLTLNHQVRILGSGVAFSTRGLWGLGVTCSDCGYRSTDFNPYSRNHSPDFNPYYGYRGALTLTLTTNYGYRSSPDFNPYYVALLCGPLTDSGASAVCSGHV